MAADDVPRLIMVQGPDPGAVMPLAEGRTVIGRDDSADARVAFAAVSRQHAAIERDGSRFTLSDLGSTFGTTLNGEPVEGPTELRPGDEIGLVEGVVLRFEVEAEEQAMAAESVEDSQPMDSAPEVPVDAGSKDEPSPGEPDSNQTAVHQAIDDEAADATSASQPRPDPLQATSVSDSGLRQRLAATTIGDEPLELLTSNEPPTLKITIAGQPSAEVVLSAASISFGRNADQDVRIDSPIVSRHHGRFERADGGFNLIVSADASNPVLADGKPVTGSHRLRDGEVLRIGGQDPGSMVTIEYLSPAERQAKAPEKITFQDRTEIDIGRDPTNDVVLDSPMVSRFHAKVERVGKRFRVQDLNSSNGTFINGERLTGERWLNETDTIRIGPHRFEIGAESLAQYDDSNDIRVEVRGLNKWVRKDLNILQDISLALQPREFVVVVGQSGGGKSTLVDAIAGYRPATHGQVLVNGVDVYRHFDSIRNIIGYVPQKDIIHNELTVYEALDYAAQLRMPPDTSKAERHQRIEEVLEELDLAHRQDVQISGLSGGQQKRVSIGVELLTKPGLFFLDEPSSGLDPGTETALMQLMRRLADQGRTIVLITHATKNVLLADKVAFLARGGYLAWFGPPDEALTYFDHFRSERDRRARPIEFDDIYALLADPANGTPQEWAQRYQQHPAYLSYVVEPLQQEGGGAGLGQAAAQAVQPVVNLARKQISAFRQFMILSARNIKILTRDRFSLGLMLAAAPLVGLLDVVLSLLLPSAPFDFNEGSMPTVLITMFLLAVYGVMVGGLSQMREIVKESEIYRRERLVNLKILPYVLSKVWVAALFALYQAAAYVIIHYLAFRMPGGVLEFLMIYITLALATMAGMMIGLFASALAPSANAAPMLVILFMLPQIVLGGALVPLPPWVSAVTSTSWAFKSFLSITGPGSDIAGDICFKLPEEQRFAMTTEEKLANGCDCIGPNALDQDNCNFPGVGAFYNEAIDQPEPEAPPPPPDRPADPDLPPPPAEPEDQSDSVAVAEYLDALQQYQDEVNQIQSESEAAFASYEAELEVYQAKVAEYQQARIQWQLGREAAIQPVEGMINASERDFGWAFADKEDPLAYWGTILASWLAQGIIIGLLFVAILILQKRKDVV